MKVLYPLLMACLTFQACKKEDNVKKFTFTNKLPQKIVVDIYGSEDDYYNNTNRLYTGIAPANNILDIPYSIFKNEKQLHYIDWYSEDYTYSNWNDVTNDDIITPSDSSGFTTADAEHSYIQTARQLAIGGNGIKSKWKTTGSVHNNQLWNALSPNERDYEIELRKDMKATVKAKNTTFDCPVRFSLSYGNLNIMLKTKDAFILLSHRYFDNTIDTTIPPNSNKLFLFDPTGLSNGLEGLYVEKQP